MKTGKNTKVWEPQTSILLDCEIGDDCVIHGQCWIGNNVKIGNRVKIEAKTFIPEGVTIEDDVFIAPNVTFTNDPHLMVKGKEFWEATLVQNYAKIGAGALIKAGVTIGEGAIIGMGAVVLKDVPAWETWVGNPAHKLERKNG